MEEEIDDKGEIGIQKFLISTEPWVCPKKFKKSLECKKIFKINIS